MEPVGGGLPVDTLREIALEVGTPTYVYDGAVLDRSIRRWVDAVGDPGVLFYAVKANSNLAILERIGAHGLGFEVATSGELARVRRAGIPSSRIVAGGVPKDESGIADAIREGVDLLVLQAEYEIEAARRLADPARPIRTALRVRPGIRAGAHPSLETARADAKFGLSPEQVPAAWERLAASPGLEPVGLAFHLGSGLDSTEPYARAIDALLGLVEAIARKGPPVTEVDLGGGLGVDYAGGADPAPMELVDTARSKLDGSGLRVRYEPGRSIVARSGVLLTRVLYRRERKDRPAIVCDAGHTDFIRYAYYGAQHVIEPLEGAAPSGAPTMEVLGPTCESGDVLGTDRRLHDTRPGDLLAVRDVGAYGFVMASNYNSRPRPAEILVEDGAWRVVRPRESLEDLWRGETDALREANVR